eukprot:gnl/Spiro4/1343_TR715_c0_g1_i1.p1 gnl/Spiro4/1343_TR715_c0_g1~~gnl/Spiro4/1343_TR715_c0_g1_i1.p1  ORF type:complete len:494 (-),score=62.49 gnl/Spiro4/1343_TR715_c0_g1_i1:77-1558(-)
MSMALECTIFALFTILLLLVVLWDGGHASRTFSQPVIQLVSSVRYANRLTRTDLSHARPATTPPTPTPEGGGGGGAGGAGAAGGGENSADEPPDGFPLSDGDFRWYYRTWYRNPVRPPLSATFRQRFTAWLASQQTPVQLGGRGVVLCDFRKDWRGLGNYFLGAFTCLTIAFLTDRSYYFAIGPTEGILFGDLVRSEFRPSAELLGTLDQLPTRTFDELRQMDNPLYYPCHHAEEHFFNSTNLTTWMAGFPQVVRMRPWYNAAPLLWLNKDFAPFLDELFPNASYSVVLMNMPLRPPASMISTVKEYAAANFGNHTIGIHIRYQNTFGNDDGHRLFVVGIDHFFPIAPGRKYFVATLIPGALNLLKAHLGSAIIYRESPMNDREVHDADHDREAIIQFLLLVASDEMILTSYSTFGYIAHALTGRNVIRCLNQYVEKGPLVLRPYNHPEARCVVASANVPCHPLYEGINDKKVFPQCWPDEFFRTHESLVGVV